jgi:hypothetical protein
MWKSRGFEWLCASFPLTLQRFLGGLFILWFIVGCAPAPKDQELAAMANRLGYLQGVADTYHPEMKPVFQAAKAQGLDQSPEFLKQKEKHYKCLRLLNEEILRLQHEFDKRILAKGGASNPEMNIYYQLLEESKNDPKSSFTKFCRLRFDLVPGLNLSVGD